MQPITQQPMAYYNPSNAPLPTNMPAVPHHHTQPPPPHVLNSQQVPTVNGSVHPDEMNVLPGRVPICYGKHVRHRRVHFVCFKNHKT